MNSLNLLKSKMLWTGGWIVEDPRRAQMVLLALSALALVATVIAGASMADTLFAGMAAGGSGGNG
jgi:hypothetical protein